MSIDIFENLEHITLDEYAKAGSEDATMENYTGIVLDPDKNKFSVVKGRFYDKKDFYTKMRKRGLILRKCYETGVYEFIQKFAKSSFDAYLMLSTSVSKWKNNNILGEYYVKILNEIPKLNRERLKGDPNSIGQGKLMKKHESVTESLLTELNKSDLMKMSLGKDAPKNNYVTTSHRDLDLKPGQRVVKVAKRNDVQRERDAQYDPDGDWQYMDQHDVVIRGLDADGNVVETKTFDDIETPNYNNDVFSNKNFSVELLKELDGEFGNNTSFTVTDNGKPVQLSRKYIKDGDGNITFIASKNDVINSVIQKLFSSNRDAYKEKKQKRNNLKSQLEKTNTAIQAYHAALAKKPSLENDEKFTTNLRNLQSKRGSLVALIPIVDENYKNMNYWKGATPEMLKSINAATSRIDDINTELSNINSTKKEPDETSLEFYGRLKNIYDTRGKELIDERKELLQSLETLYLNNVDAKRKKDIETRYVNYLDDSKYKERQKAKNDAIMHKIDELNVKQNPYKANDPLIGEDGLNDYQRFQKERQEKIYALSDQLRKDILTPKEKAYLYKMISNPEEYEYNMNKAVDPKNMRGEGDMEGQFVDILNKKYSDKDLEKSLLSKLGKTVENPDRNPQGISNNSYQYFTNDGKPLSQDEYRSLMTGYNPNVQSHEVSDINASITLPQNISDEIKNEVNNEVESKVDNQIESEIQATINKALDMQTQQYLKKFQNSKTAEELEVLANQFKDENKDKVAQEYEKAGIHNPENINDRKEFLINKYKPEIDAKINEKENEVKNEVRKLLKQDGKTLADIDDTLFAKAFENLMNNENEVEESYVNKGADLLNLQSAEAGLNQYGQITEGITNGQLNPNLFENEKLKKEVRAAMLEIAYKFLDNLSIQFDPEDIYFTGSCANYNYNEDSDIDLHLVFDVENAGINAEIFKKYLQSAKTVFNSKYNIMIKGIPVEVGFELTSEPLITTGIYSVKDDKWIKLPEYKEKEYNDVNLPYYENIVKTIEDAIQSQDLSTIEALWQAFGAIRKESLKSEGEFGIGNLLFKKLRANKFLDRLKDAYYQLSSKELSLEGME